jgi:cobalamin biosynthesis Mg chelatase CobN
MKFLIPLAIFAISGASAATKACEAQYILDRCLVTEKVKVDDCGALDYDCQCAAYQAIATCYNNCPNDVSASSAQNQVKIFCQNASLYGTAAQASKTAAADKSEATGSMTTANLPASTTSDDEENDESSTSSTKSGASPTESADSPGGTGAGANLARNTGGLLLAVAGVVVAML